MAKLGHMVSTNEDLGVEDLEFGTEDTNAEDVGERAIETIDACSDIDEAVGLMDNQAEILDGSADAVDKISEVQEVISENPDEEATETEVAVLESFTSSILSTLGLTGVIPTTESYKGITRGSLVASLEDKKSNIVDKIVQAMKSMMDMVAGFIQKIVQNRALLGRYLVSLNKSIVKHKDGDGEVASKFKDASSVLSALDASEKLINVADRAAVEFKSIEKTTDLGFDDLVSSMKVIQTTDYSNGIGNPEMAGGGKLQFKKDDKIKIHVETPDTPVTQGQRLTSQQCAQVISRAMKVLTSLKKMESVGNRIVQYGKSMAAKLSSILSARSAMRNEAAGNLEEAEKGATRAIGRVAANAYRNLAMNFGATVPSLVFKNIKAAADYVKASIA